MFKLQKNRCSQVAKPQSQLPLENLSIRRLASQLFSALLISVLTFACSSIPLNAQGNANAKPGNNAAGSNTADNNTAGNNTADKRIDENNTAVESYEILGGRLPVLAILQYIHDTTGKIVLYPSMNPDAAFEKDSMIHILGDIKDISYAGVKAILEANGFVLFEEPFEGGLALRVSFSAGARGSSPAGNPVTPIIKKSDQLNRQNPEEVATLIMEIKFVDPQTIQNTIRELIGGGTGRGADATQSVKVIPINSSNTLILRGKVNILQHIREIVDIIDRDAPGPKPILEIIDVYNADVSELVQLVSDVLNIQANSVGSRSGARRNTRTNNTRRNTNAKGAQNAAQNARVQEGQGEYTRLIADLRSSKILVDTTSETQLQLIVDLINELDTKVENLRPSTHIYHVRFLKAEDLANDISRLVDGVSRSGGNLRGNRNAGARGTSTNTNQQSSVPTRIVPHNDTNSLIIQAEYEEYLEIERILDGIDRKRKQVFLEVALVQVNEGSNFSYAIEYLAGDLDDSDTRIAALSAFGLSAPTLTTNPLSIGRNFNNDGLAAATGLLAAVSNDGQLPVILRALKTDTNSKIIATPFILADDNEASSISSTTTVFFQTTTNTNSGSSTSQGSEEAGIELSLTPTISENVVLLEMSLSVSSFGSASSGTGGVPDRSNNVLQSHITVANGELFIIGGLAREQESLAVDKIPLLGDLPLIGRFFQSRNSQKSRNNLYVFITAHILRSDDFDELRDLTRQGKEGVNRFDKEMNPQFVNPKSSAKRVR